MFIQVDLISPSSPMDEASILPGVDIESEASDYDILPFTLHAGAVGFCLPSERFDGATRVHFRDGSTVWVNMPYEEFADILDNADLGLTICQN